MKNFIRIIANLLNYFKHLQTEENSIFSDSNFSNFFFLFGSLNLFFLFMIFSCSALTFALGRSLTSLQILIALFTTGSFSFLAARIYYPKKYILAGLTLILAFLITFLSCAFVAGKFYDLSYDGQWYHQGIILTLAHGWNPVYQHLSKTNTQNYLNKNSSGIAYILNSYPKAAEIYETALFQLTQQIELSKLFNLFLVITAFSLSFALFLNIKMINNLLAFVLSTLLVLNPVSICEAISFYIDGQVYSLMLCLLALVAMAFFSKKSFILLPLLCAISLLVNIKLTALIFSLILIFVLLCFCWYSEKIHVFVKILLACTVAFISSILILGINPFITNAIYYHNPLYPAAGKNSLDFAAINAPRNYYGLNSLELLALSTFAKSDFVKGPNKYAQPKVPFTFTEKEIQAFTSTDPIEGGFGPLFSGAIILSIDIFIYSISCRKRNLVRLILLTVFTILISCLLISASFYARFIPQFWLIPCLALLLGFMLKDKFAFLLSLCLLVILIINNIIIIKTNLPYNLARSSEMKKQLTDITKFSQKNQLAVNFGDFESNSQRFREAGINFTENKTQLTCPSKVSLLGNLIPESKIAACQTPSLR